MTEKKLKSINSIKYPKDVKINSLIIAIVLSINYIASSFSRIVNLPNIILVLSMFLFVFLFIRNKFRIKKAHIIFVIITGIQVVVSLISIDSSDSYQIRLISGYILNAIILVYFISYEYSFNKICEYICIIFISLIWSLLFFDKSNYSSGGLMGLSYSILPFFISSIYCLFNHKKYNTFIIYIILVTNIIYIINIYKFVTRGVVLSVVIYILLLYFLNSKRSFKKYNILLLSIITSVFAIIYFKEVIIFFNNIFLEYNIEIKFFEKTSYLLEQGNLGNSRSFIQEISWKSFKQNPIFGNGIAALDRLYNINYDHSFIFQLLNEGGVFFSFIHFILLFKGLYIIISKKTKDSNVSNFLLFLLCNSIIRLLFSSVLWLEQGYWMFLYIAFTYTEIKIERN